METPGLALRECSVRLQRYDHGRGPSFAQDYRSTPLVMIKMEYDAQDTVVSQGHGAGLPLTSEDIDMVFKEEGDMHMKTEDEVNEVVLVKQELDIEPTVLQERKSLWQIPPPTQTGPDPRSSGGPGGGASQAPLTAAVPRAHPEDYYRGRKSGGPSEVGSVSEASTDGDRGALAPEQCRAGGGARDSARPFQGSATERARGTAGPGASADRDIGGGRYECDYCKRRTMYKSSLLRHIHNHTGDKPYKCKLCEYSSSRNSSLKRHILTHTGEKPHKCKLCEYSSSRNSTLKLHMRTHTGEKPYKCTICKYSASYLISLKTHMFSHIGEKPFKCNLCEYSTSQKSTLKVHMCTHTGYKPHKCKFCEYSTSRSSNLHKHVRTHNVKKTIQM